MLARVRGSAFVLRRVVGQRRALFSAPERLVELRDARVRKIVLYAAETVPFYRDFFREEGIDAREISTAAQLERLPLLDRESVQRDPERFRSDSRRGADAVLFETGGTPGASIPIYHDAPSLLENLAYGERERVIESALCRIRRRAVSIHIGWTYSSTGDRVRAFYRRSTLAPGRPRVPLALSDPFESVVERFNEVGPDIVVSTGSYLESFFRLVSARGVDLRVPRLAIYSSDLMTVPGRRFIEKTFGIPVISRYNATEALKIGFTCEQREAFHVHDDLCFLRIVDSDGAEVAPGETGEIVISNLVNHGTVLLNYRLGDVGTLVAPGCECGRTTQLLETLEGRANNVLQLLDGSFVHEGAVHIVVHRWPEVITYQLVQQTELDRFELKLVTADDPGYRRVEGRIARELQTLLGGSSSVEVTRHDELPRGPRGKFRYVVPLTDD